LGIWSWRGEVVEWVVVGGWVVVEVALVETAFGGGSSGVITGVATAAGSAGGNGSDNGSNNGGFDNSGSAAAAAAAVADSSAADSADWGPADGLAGAAFFLEEEDVFFFVDFWAFDVEETDGATTSGTLSEVITWGVIEFLAATVFF